MSNDEKKPDLPASLQRLYDAFLLVGPPSDTPALTIEAMHNAVYGATEGERRDMQQRVGPYVTKLNRRIRGHKLIVKPGDLKGTYVLATID